MPQPTRPASSLLRNATAFLCALASPLAAQEPKLSCGYPARDVLSPFRAPDEIAAPPDALFAALRTMRRIADDPAAVKSFDVDGREVIDDEMWRAAREEAERIGVDAGMIAVQIRSNRNADERALAFYGAFFCGNIDHVFNLISHIPGEPVRQTRERAYPRAIAFLKAHVGRRFGDLSPERKAAIQAEMPQIGSPAAKARGITRMPTDEDMLHTVHLPPFYQLLDLDDAMDQAQGLWFVKETCLARRDLAASTLEPALPRIRQLLRSPEASVRHEAFGVFCAIADKDLKVPDAKDTAAVESFAVAAGKSMFPPLRRTSEGLLWLLPGEERDALVAAALAALDKESLGRPDRGETSSGVPFRGFRIDTVPEALASLAIPQGAVILSVNGVAIHDAKSLRKAVEDQFWFIDRSESKEGVKKQKSTATIVVEYQKGDETKAMEYRVR
jgi:hypothetical protein